MRSTPKTIQPPRSELDKPAKERIVEQANRLFTLGGVKISTALIAHFAHTNVATVFKHFGTRERLVFDFLKSLMKQADLSWKEIEQDNPNDPEAQLRNWVLCAQFSADLSTRKHTPNCHALRSISWALTKRALFWTKSKGFAKPNEERS